MGRSAWAAGSSLGPCCRSSSFRTLTTREATGTEGEDRADGACQRSVANRQVPFVRRLSYAKGFGLSLLTRVNFPTGSQGGVYY